MQVSFFTKFCVLVLLISVSSGCVATTKVKTVAGPQGKPVAYSSQKAPSVFEVYDRVYQPPKVNTDIPSIMDGAVPSGHTVRVRMGSQFSRIYELCNASRVCKEVRPVSNQKANYGEEPDKADDTIIADVELRPETNNLFGARIPESHLGRSILLMEPDVELSLLTAGGLQEPNAFWTASAKSYVTEIATQYFQELGHSVTLYKDGANGLTAQTGRDLINLHEAVGKSIFQYQYPGIFQLPTMQNDKFDWQSGRTTQALQNAYGADLGLFVYLRDSYSSGSRVAAQVLMAALFGAHIPGGQQVGFVSLVDLKTGDIVWYNRLFSGSGDLRTFGAAVNSTNSLLVDIPL